MQPVHLVTPVWGRKYCELFCDVMLPSLLAPGNIPSIPAASGHGYKIYTTLDDAPLIRASAAFGRLESTFGAEVRLISSSAENKYHVSSDCYREAAAEAAVAGAALIMLPPDVIVADGSIRSLARHLASGKQAILLTGVRTLVDEMVPEVKARFSRDGQVCAPPRQLVKLALEHLHPIADAHMFDGDSEYYHPVGLFWKIRDEGLLLHSFHLHPVAIQARSIRTDFAGTIDDDMLERTNFSDDAVHISGDSDEALVVELSARDHACTMLKRGGLDDIVLTVSSITNQFHRKIVRAPMRIHAAGTAGPEWERAERRAQFVIGTILDSVARVERLRAGTASLRERVPAKLQNAVQRSRRYLSVDPAVRAGWPPFVAFKMLAAACILATCSVLGALGIVQIEPRERP